MSDIQHDTTGTCHWCLQEAPVQTIQDKLWNFWGIISNENPPKESLKYICEKCKSRYTGFSTFIESCKNNETIVATVLNPVKVKEEPSFDTDDHPLVDSEIVKEPSSFENTPPSIEERKDVDKSKEDRSISLRSVISSSVVRRKMRAGLDLLEQRKRHVREDMEDLNRIHALKMKILAAKRELALLKLEILKKRNKSFPLFDVLN